MGTEETKTSLCFKYNHKRTLYTVPKENYKHNRDLAVGPRTGDAWLIQFSIDSILTTLLTWFTPLYGTSVSDHPAIQLLRSWTCFAVRELGTLVFPFFLHSASFEHLDSVLMRHGLFPVWFSPALPLSLSKIMQPEICAKNYIYTKRFWATFNIGQNSTIIRLCTSSWIFLLSFSSLIGVTCLLTKPSLYPPVSPTAPWLPCEMHTRPLPNTCDLRPNDTHLHILRMAAPFGKNCLWIGFTKLPKKRFSNTNLQIQKESSITLWLLYSKLGSNSFVGYVVGIVGSS